MATKRQTRRRRITRSISRTPFGTRRKASRFARSKTPGSRASRSQKSRTNSNARLRAYDARQHALARRSLRHRGVRQLRTLDRRQRRPAAETLIVPKVDKRLHCTATAAARRSRPAPPGIRAHDKAFVTIGANDPRCPRPLRLSEAVGKSSSWRTHKERSIRSKTLRSN